MKAWMKRSTTCAAGAMADQITERERQWILDHIEKNLRHQGRWDGTEADVDRAWAYERGTMHSGTAFVEPGDRVGPGYQCAHFFTDSKGIGLRRVGDPEPTVEREVYMSWKKIRAALLERTDVSDQMTLSL